MTEIIVTENTKYFSNVFGVFYKNYRNFQKILTLLLTLRVK